MNRLSILIPALAFMLFIPLASAHQPRVSMGLDIHSENTSLLVHNPEISQAFYGELTGQPDYYRIVLENATRIYFGLTVPYIPEAMTDLTVELYDYKDTAVTQVLLLDGTKSHWKPFYEEFGGDWYLQGPESRENLTNVTYYIKVSSPSNQGRYALAIGEVEAFPPDEIANTYLALPVIKQNFFGKPIPWLFFHFFGIALAMGGFFSASAIVLTARRQRMKSAVDFFGKIRYLVWLGMLLIIATLAYAFIQSPLSLLGMLRGGVFLLLLLLLLHANGRVRRIEDKAPAILKLNILLSVLLWIVFLFLSSAFL